MLLWRLRMTSVTSRAVTIVAQTGEVELDVAESAGSFGLEPGDSLPEHPQHDVVDARARRHVAIDRTGTLPVELVEAVVGERAVFRVGICGVLDEQGARDLQQAVLSLTEEHRA